MMRAYMAVRAIAGWFALLLQFPLTIAISLSNGMSMPGAVITYFSFFTILTNLMVTVALTAICGLRSRGWAAFSLDLQ
jgi:hypothetical protein